MGGFGRSTKMNTESQYTTAVQKVLDSLKKDIQSRFDNALENLPSGTEGLELLIFTDQYGKGLLDVRLSLSGKDKNILNKAMLSFSDIIKTKFVDGELKPPFPLLDLMDIDFDSNEALTNSAAFWIMNELDTSNCNLPLLLDSPVGDSKFLPLTL